MFTQERRTVMTNMERAWRLLIAANDEALRAGHTQVDTDHVLLGLLVIDGESAAQLRVAGLTLEAARTAMAAVIRDDLAAIGIADDGWAVPPPKRYAAEVLPFTDRAMTAIKRLRRKDADTAVLSDLLADGAGPAARLLAAAGVDVTDAAAARADSPAAADGDWSGVLTRVVPVAPERIWALLDDPLRRPEWDEDAGTIEVVDASTFRGVPRLVTDAPTMSKALGITGIHTTYRLAERTPGEHIAWEAQFPGRGGVLRPRRPHTEYLRIAIAPDADGHSRLTLAVRFRRGKRRRLLDRAFDSTASLRLGLLAQALAQAA